MKGDAWAVELKDGGLPALTKLREMGENMQSVIRRIYARIFPSFNELLEREFRIVKEGVK